MEGQEQYSGKQLGGPWNDPGETEWHVRVATMAIF